MVLNKKAQVFFYALMIGVILIVLGLALAGPVKDTVDSARNQTTDEGQLGLDCTNSSISSYDKATCVVADLTIFHFIGGIIFIAGALLTAKFIIQ